MTRSKSDTKAAGRFPKGQSGNPAGRPPGVPNKATIEIKAFCRGLFNRPKFRQTLEKQWDDGTLDPSFRRLLTHYAYGVPTTTIDAGHNLVSMAKLLAGDFTEEDT